MCTALLYTRVGTNSSWFVNHESISWSSEPKNFKTFIFHKLFFRKCDNFKIISTDDICLSICLVFKEWSWTMKEHNSVDYVVIHYNYDYDYQKKFSWNNIFFLNSNPVHCKSRKKVRVIIFPFILSCLSFVSNAIISSFIL